MPDMLHFTGTTKPTPARGEPLALLVGFALDQQVTVPTAFAGPLKLKQRLGTLDAARDRGNRSGRADDVFRERPAIHRFPATWRARQECARSLPRSTTATLRASGATLRRGRPEAADRALPGFGEMKVKALGSVLAKRFGVEVAEELVPDHPTLGDVDSPEALGVPGGEARVQSLSARRQGRDRP